MDNCIEIKSKEAERGGYFNDRSGNKHNDKCDRKFESNNIGHFLHLTECLSWHRLLSFVAESPHMPPERTVGLRALRGFRTKRPKG